MMDIINIQGLPFLACLIMLGLLSYIGIHVLKREVIFIDIALAQFAAVGAISAHVVFHLHENPVAENGLAFMATLIAAAFFAIVRRRIRQIPLEAVIGVSYAVSAAAALFIVGVSPGGHVHVQEMLSGSILWATWSDVKWTAGVFAAVGLCFYLFRGQFRTISENYDSATDVSHGTLGWDFLFYALVGIVITTAVRIAGVVVVFTFLIVPATLSAVFATGWGTRLAVGWTAGAISAALGLLFANRFDFSVGPSISLFLGLALVLAGLLRAARMSGAVTVAVSLAIALALGGWLAAGGAAVAEMGDAGGGTRAGGGAPSAGAITHSHSHDYQSSGGDVAAVTPEAGDGLRPRDVTNAGRLMTMYRSAGDDEERCEIISRMLEVDLGSGVKLALEFLEGDPPLLFRLTVVDDLTRTTGIEMGYDIERPFSADVNRKSVAALKLKLD